MLAHLTEWVTRVYEESTLSTRTIRRVSNWLGMFARISPRGGSLRTLQEIRLRQTVRYVSRHSPFYQRMFREAGIKPGEIHTLEDLQRLPFTLPADLQNWQDFTCVPPDQMAAVFTSSGTTGEPKRIYYTQRDLEILTNFSATVLRWTFTGRLVVMLALPGGSGLWIGSATGQRYIEKAGGLALPFASGDPHLMLSWMRRFEPNLVISSPSFMTTLTRAAQQEQYLLPLDQIVVGGEPLYAEQREYISQYWNAPVLNSYGATELGGAQTLAFAGGENLALNDFHLLTEIVDPETGAPSSEGELVFTTLRREGMPLLRYRIGDRARWVQSAPDLPVSSIQLLRRTDDFIVLSDMGLYGQVIADALRSVPGFSGKLVFHIDRLEMTDRLTLQLGGSSIDTGTVQALLVRLYPEIASNLENGNLLLRIETGYDLGQQLKAFRIVDDR